MCGKSNLQQKVTLWHRPNPKFTTFVLAGVSLTNTYDITHITAPSNSSSTSFAFGALRKHCTSLYAKPGLIRLADHWPSGSNVKPLPYCSGIIPFLSFNTPAPAPAASRDCWHVTRFAVWSDLSPNLYPALDPFCNTYEIVNFYSIIVQHKQCLNSQAFGARDGIKSNIICFTKNVSWNY